MRNALKGDVISIDEIAAQKGVAVASVRIALQDFRPEGYKRVGDRFFILRAKLNEIDEKLRGVERLTKALEIIEDAGVKDGGGDKVLEALGYSSIWEGMEMDIQVSQDNQEQ